MIDIGSFQNVNLQLLFVTIPGGAAVTKMGHDSLVFRVVMFSQQAVVSKDSRASMALPMV